MNRFHGLSPEELANLPNRQFRTYCKALYYSNESTWHAWVKEKLDSLITPSEKETAAQTDAQVLAAFGITSMEGLT